MVKFPVSFQISHETNVILEAVKSSLMKSKNWIVENAIFKFSNDVKGLVALDNELRDYLEVKKDGWKDNLYGEMLRYNLSKGFMLKNSIRKIYEMVESGVNKPHIEKVIVIYGKLCNDEEYMGILRDLKKNLMNENKIDLNRIRLKIDSINERRSF